MTKITTVENYIFSIESILTNSDIELKENDKIRKLVGIEGYFANTLAGLKDYIDLKDFDTLENVIKGEINGHPFASKKGRYSFFLPKCKVTRPFSEIDYRPFKNVKEFIETVKCASYGFERYKVVRLRRKSISNKTMILQITGFVVFNNDEETLDYVTLSNTDFTPKELFNDYVWLDDKNNEHVFGVKE